MYECPGITHTDIEKYLGIQIPVDQTLAKTDQAGHRVLANQISKVTLAAPAWPQLAPNGPLLIFLVPIKSRIKILLISILSFENLFPLFPS